MRAWQLGLAVLGWLCTSTLMLFLLYQPRAPALPCDLSSNATQPPLPPPVECVTLRWQHLVVDEHGAVCISERNDVCCSKMRPLVQELETSTTLMHSKWQCFVHLVHCVAYCVQRREGTLLGCGDQCKSSGTTYRGPQWPWVHCVHGQPEPRKDSSATHRDSDNNSTATKIQWLRL